MSALAHHPLVIGTIGPQGLASLAALPARERGADMVEARFDLALPALPVAVPAPMPGAALPDLRPFFATCATLEASGTPVLGTIRLPADGGRWPLDAERLPWFDQALAVVSWVDVEVESAVAAEVVALAHARGRRVIVSHHDFARTPDATVLDDIVARAHALGGDVVKIATAIRSMDDHYRLIDLLRRQPAPEAGTLALIGMGALGTALRSYLPALGSRFTYGYLDTVAAPGQIPAPELVRRLLTDCPAYATGRAQAHWERTKTL